MFWTRKHQIESSNHEGFFKNFPCCRQFLQEFYKVQTNFVGFYHAKCLNFPCFINYLPACMHAFCMFYLYVSLGSPHCSTNPELIQTFQQATQTIASQIQNLSTQTPEQNHLPFSPIFSIFNKFFGLNNASKIWTIKSSTGWYFAINCNVNRHSIKVILQ